MNFKYTNTIKDFLHFLFESWKCLYFSYCLDFALLWAMARKNTQDLLYVVEAVKQHQDVIADPVENNQIQMKKFSILGNFILEGFPGFYQFII